MEDTLRKLAFLPLFVVALLQAQSINIGNFYYRDYLDFGQNKGSFNDGISSITGKDGTSFNVPNVPTFAASSNYGSLTAVGRGFAVTANHVSSPESISDLRKWGLTQYNIATESVSDKDGNEVSGVSKPYGSDTKFIRFDKFVVEGQMDMLNVENSTTSTNTANEITNIENLKKELDRFAKDSEGNVYIYQAGSGSVTLRGTNNPQNFNTNESGELKGGGFGTLQGIRYSGLVQHPESNLRGILFGYSPNGDFNNRITSGDSGSGFYAYDKVNDKWVLLGVTSMAWGNQAMVSFASNKDFEDYRTKFEQSINLNGLNLILQKPVGSPLQLGNTTLSDNKDIIFSNGGNIEVKSNIDRMQSGYAGGFVFADAQTKTTYQFTNEQGKNYFFKGSGLDIGENVEVEWHLRNQSNDSLHKIGKGTLIVKTHYTPSNGENLGFLKVGEGKVVLDTATKAFEGIYITSGRGEVALVQGKAEAIGAVKNATSYTLKQNSTNDMGFFFGTGGGLLDLSGNNLTLNTIAANDSKAIIANSGAMADLEIQGFGYDNNGNKTSNKADTIIHASFGETSTNGTNLNLIYKDSANASLIFDGHINTKGALNATNSNIVLQGHPTAHATISNKSIIDKITNAENGTSQKMPDYMDLSKPSNLNQPDWDSRNFIFEKGIDLTNSTLTIGKGAKVKANISANKNSQIFFGGKHFIDEQDTKNVRGSGFDYYQNVKSGLLQDELYKNSSYSGTIKADGASITSQFSNFAPNLELLNKASLKAKFLTLNANNTLNFKSNSTATIENLVFQGVNNLDKIKLDDTSTFEIKEGFIFDQSNFNLDNLKSNTLILPTEYNLAALNGSNITASTLNASGKLSLNADENSSIKLDTLNLQKGDVQNVSENVAINTLNLNESSAKLANANITKELNLDNKSTATLDTLTSIPNTTLNNGSTLYLNTLDLNDFGVNLTSDDSSAAHIKRLLFDNEGTKKHIPQSNLTISELLILNNVGKNLGQNTEQEKLDKDLLALEFGKTLTLQNNSTLEINFADMIKKDNKELKFNEFYTIFTANTFICNKDNVNVHLNFAQSSSNFFAQGNCDNQGFFVKFVKENPRNFAELNPHINPAYSPLLEVLLEHNKFDESIEKAINSGDYNALNQRLARLDTSFSNFANADKSAFKTLPRLQKQEINARIQQNRFTNAKFALARAKNLMQKSDVAPTLAYLMENEQKNRAWSSAGASFFSNKGDKFNLQSMSIGYDRRFFGDEFLLGIMANFTNAQLSSSNTSFNPKIYTFALYSDALFARSELQNQFSISHLNGDKSFESEIGSYKGLNSFFESIYKVELTFLPQNLKPLMLGRLNLSYFDDFATQTYKQKADNDISVDFGIGIEWLWQKKSGFYSASFMAERDIFHTQKDTMMSLRNAQKFIAYETNDPSFSYQLYLTGLENFANGIYLRYGFSSFIDTKAYKGVKGDIQLGYKF